ncbi:thermonuclease family protein [Serratia nevei]|uniref:thermonuclease family protein n=1 Tax=Serratia nevei TaxID=2703794 RepID=UPI003F76276B
MLKKSIMLITLLVTTFCSAKEIQGRVIRVLDGDTIEIKTLPEKLPVYEVPVRIRLLNIDAPEKGQPFGRWSTEQLKSMVAGKAVTVIYDETDRYGRVLGRITVNGYDVNRAMVRVGAAWVYERYNMDKDLNSVQHEAQLQKRGLWVEKNPMPPWVWRHQYH